MLQNLHHDKCPFCKWVELVKEKKWLQKTGEYVSTKWKQSNLGLSQSSDFSVEEILIEENQSFLSLTNVSPDSYGHVLIITKEPRTNITELTPQEWDNLLLILTSTTNRLINFLNPIGFNIYSNAGDEGKAQQAVFHFHLHIVPEREGNYGVGYLRKPNFIPSPQEYKEIKKYLSIDEQGMIKENKRAVVKLIDREQASDYGHAIIESKENKQNDLNQIDMETWSQMGELLRDIFERIEKIKSKLGSLRVYIPLGKIGGLPSTSKFKIHLIPRYRSQGNKAKEDISVPLEVLELTKKLRKVENELVRKEVEFSKLKSKL